MAENYEKESVIGSGTFGRAWLVVSKINKRKYVLKEILVRGLSKKQREQSLTEVAVLSRCKHWNIIRYKDAFVTSNMMLNLVMEFADGGDLSQKIQQQNGQHFSTEVILDWFVQICFALKYIHGQKFLHRDLKTQNVFLTSENVIKVGDFGIAKMLEGSQDHADTAIGTPYYLSPEICQQKPYNYKTDMWSLGCILYELICLTHAFDGSNFTSLVVKIMQGKYKPIPRKFGPLLDDLVAVLLRLEPESRPSAQQILYIPAIKSYVENCVLRQREVYEKKLSGSITDTPQPQPGQRETSLHTTDASNTPEIPQRVTKKFSSFLPESPKRASLGTPDVSRRVKKKAPSCTPESAKEKTAFKTPDIPSWVKDSSKEARRPSAKKGQLSSDSSHVPIQNLNERTPPKMHRDDTHAQEIAGRTRTFSFRTPRQHRPVVSCKRTMSIDRATVRKRNKLSMPPDSQTTLVQTILKQKEKEHQLFGDSIAVLENDPPVFKLSHKSRQLQDITNLSQERMRRLSSLTYSVKKLLCTNRNKEQTQVQKNKHPELSQLPVDDDDVFTGNDVLNEKGKSKVSKFSDASKGDDVQAKVNQLLLTSYKLNLHSTYATMEMISSFLERQLGLEQFGKTYSDIRNWLHGCHFDDISCIRQMVYTPLILRLIELEEK
ncbi:serine/threonine-protein kinase Nek3-like [Lingula anatina]|uniref:non-specific serine/threonine protein kinase n=1 Tax=Lingula anatina TaxID=7574 RepID=A0A1S3JDT6_LINAN|nr:serine/threonine-protein kinase Nek3-like [Lingula anatina]|eukprot:XP_013408054.1 serine/threonine-protein kinase Nek3-like [Lingula anatina]